MPVDESMRPCFLNRGYGGEIFGSLFTLLMKIESDPERRAVAMIEVPPLLEKGPDTFLRSLIRPILRLR